MDQVAREDIAAAAAARRELGSSYDDAFAESLIERISVEIDKRVDARLASTHRSARIDTATLERRRRLWQGAAIGATAMAVPSVIAIVKDSYNHKPAIIVVLLWMVIAAGYAIATWAHIRRQLDDRGD